MIVGMVKLRELVFISLLVGRCHKLFVRSMNGFG